MALRRLGAEHYIAIKYLALPKKGGKTIAEIAQEAGVSERSIYNWLKDPLFERELKAEMVRNSRDKLPELINSLADIAIRDGNAAMAKLALQIHGVLTDKIEVETKVSTQEVDYEALDSELEAFAETNEESGE